MTNNTSRTTTNNPSTLINSSTSTVNNEPMIQVPASLFTQMNQSSAANTNELLDKAIFSTKHVIAIIIAVITAVAFIVGIYFSFVSDIKELNSKIDDLTIKYSSVDPLKYKDDFHGIKSEVKELKQQLENYNLKSLNEEIIKLNIKVTNINLELEKNTKKLSNEK